MYQVYQENQPYIEVPTCIYLGLGAGDRVSSIPGELTLYRGSHLYISRTRSRRPCIQYTRRTKPGIQIQTSFSGYTLNSDQV